jgi:L-fuconolactonase
MANTADKSLGSSRSDDPSGMRRRQLMQIGAVVFGTLARPSLAGAQVSRSPAADKSVPIIDAHIHLYDTNRPEGVPWPPKGDVIYGPKLPPTYETLARPLGVVGAIAVEASPWEQDNFWLLDIVRKNDIMVGFVGNLVPGSDKYDADLERLAREPIFLGIRYGNLWDRDLKTDLPKPGFVAGLKKLTQTGRALDSANPTPELIAALLDVRNKVPDLRIVVDHLPAAKIGEGQHVRYFRDLQELASRPNVFVKLSEVPRSINGAPNFDEAYYHDQLELLWEIFGEDKVIFGSDWPNSEHLGSLEQTIGLVEAFMRSKGRAAQEKYFWRNSAAAYHWTPRRSDQPRPT